MRRVTRNGVIAVAAASGAMAVALPAYADSGANGSAAGSPGLISGNTVQLPAHVPVNACGNTVNVVGLLNPAAGNRCADHDGDGASGGAAAEAGAQDSPGVISGNAVQMPVHLPVNVSGNTVDVVGVGNASTGNDSSDGPGESPARPAGPDRPADPDRPARPDGPEPPAPPRARTAPEPAALTPPRATGSLAHTGADHTLPVLGASAALVAGGVVLRRRFRPRGQG
ncbi:chaplin [Streptomyces bullii]|uniref:Chaplin n=1 Tax=Streptomyces bullii TaxID=349910 RepID=A0ABW0UJE3_9ACTN